MLKRGTSFAHGNFAQDTAFQSAETGLLTILGRGTWDDVNANTAASLEAVLASSPLPLMRGGSYYHDSGIAS
jgi:hypothetical protein